MSTWPRHIDRFKLHNDMAFVGNFLFGVNIMERIQKRVKVFLYSCNMMSLDNIEMGAMLEFR